MLLYKVKDYQELSRKAANIVFAQMILKPNAVLGLATGSSPEGIYQQLVARYQTGDLDFSGIRTVNLDEYQGLSPDHPNSYHNYMNRHLFSHVNLSPDRTHIPNGLAPDPDLECKRYDRIIQELGGIDLQILGLGENGHIGFNEPDDVFCPETHVVPLTDSTVEANARFFASRADVPRRALTMGVGTIMAAQHILLVVSGPLKADVLYRAFYEPVTPRLPASILQFHPHVTVVADDGALTRINEKGHVQ